MNTKLLIPLILLSCLIVFGCGSSDSDNTGNAGDTEDTLPEVPGAELPTKNKVGKLSLDEFQTLVKKDDDTLYVYNFWATWCKPCIEEMPYFEKVASDMKDKKFKLVFVSIDNFKNSYKKVQRFVNKKDIKAEVLLLEFKDQNKLISSIDKSWNGTIPATMFVDNKNKTKLFYQQEFSYEELLAIVTPLLPMEL